MLPISTARGSDPSDEAEPTSPLGTVNVEIEALGWEVSEFLFNC